MNISNNSCLSNRMSRQSWAASALACLTVALGGCGSSTQTSTAPMADAGAPAQGGGGTQPLSDAGPAPPADGSDDEATPENESGTMVSVVPSDGGTAIGDSGWFDITANLAGAAGGCGSLDLVTAKPDEDLLIAGVVDAGLYGSRNGGDSWEKLGAGAGSAAIMNGPTAVVFDPTDSMRFWESGAYGTSPFVTIDDGATFTRLGAIQHSDLVSVDFSDPSRKTLLAGGHEQSQLLNRSTDGGMTWTNIGTSLPASTYCVFPMVIDPQTYLVGCYSVGGGPSGVYRTTNGGGSWTSATTSGGGTPPLRASDGSIYWISAFGNGMTRSTDNGVHWTDVTGSGVFASTGGHVTNGAPIELSGGRIAALGPQYVVVSSDHGMTWTHATSAVPMDSAEDLHGLGYSILRKSFYAWHNACSPTSVFPDAVVRFPYD
jgi:hypothetical protein